MTSLNVALKRTRRNLPLWAAKGELEGTSVSSQWRQQPPVFISHMAYRLNYYDFSKMPTKSVRFWARNIQVFLEDSVYLGFLCKSEWGLSSECWKQLSLTIVIVKNVQWPMHMLPVCGQVFVASDCLWHHRMDPHTYILHTGGHQNTPTNFQNGPLASNPVSTENNI
jgi:hypothetical protein